MYCAGPDVPVPVPPVAAPVPSVPPVAVPVPPVAVPVPSVPVPPVPVPPAAWMNSTALLNSIVIELKLSTTSSAAGV